MWPVTQKNQNKSSSQTWQTPVEFHLSDAHEDAKLVILLCVRSEQHSWVRTNHKVIDQEGNKEAKARGSIFGRILRWKKIWSQSKVERGKRRRALLTKISPAKDFGGRKLNHCQGLDGNPTNFLASEYKYDNVPFIRTLFSSSWQVCNYLRLLPLHLNWINEHKYIIYFCS